MTLQQLLYFRTAANLGSFNAAARALHCTQPAVSDQVRRLERELGVSLFARAGRGLTLTTAGRTFLTRAERVAEAADDALASVGHGHTAREQEVNFGTFRNAPYYGIAGLAARFCMAHPEVRLRLRGQNSFDVARAVQDGELEAGLVVLPVDDSLLDVRALFRDEVVYLTSEPRQGPVAITEVAATPLILYDLSYGFNDPTRRQLAARAQQAGVAIEPRIEVEHVETALQLVAQGMGATIAARAVLDGDPAYAGVRAYSFVEPFHDFFAVVTRRGVRVSPGTRTLLQFVDAWAEDAADRVTAA